MCRGLYHPKIRPPPKNSTNATPYIMNELTFVRTLSVNKFKEITNSGSIDVIRNPNSGKLFFVSDNGIKGAVSDSYSESPCFSEVRGENNETFWLLHKKQSDNVVNTL